VSERDPKFTSKFLKGLFNGFGTNLNFITAYHPESNGQTERVNQLIEDMLRMYVMDKPSKWEDYLHLVEFVLAQGQTPGSTLQQCTNKTLNIDPFGNTC
jgi:hypothetical protein